MNRLEIISYSGTIVPVSCDGTWYFFIEITCIRVALSSDVLLDTVLVSALNWKGTENLVFCSRKNWNTLSREDWHECFCLTSFTGNSKHKITNKHQWKLFLIWKMLTAITVKPYGIVNSQTYFISVPLKHKVHNYDWQIDKTFYYNSK